MKKILNKINPKIVFDIGSNRNIWTKEMKKILPDSQFFTFEANESHGKTKNNHYNVLLSSDEKGIEFYSRDGTGDSYYKENTKHYNTISPKTIKSKRLDKLIKEENLPNPDFIKLDTQGSELDILMGLGDGINEVSCILTEVSFFNYNDGAPKINDYIEFFNSNGFYPMTVEKIHKCDDIVVQLDLFFLHKEIKEEVYGKNKTLKI